PRFLRVLAACAIAWASVPGCHRSDDGGGGPSAPVVVTSPLPGPRVPPRVDPLRVMSPNGDVEFRLAGWPAEGSPGPSLGYRVSFRGEPVIVDSALGLELAGQPPIAPGPSQTALKTGGVDETYAVPVGKSNPVKDRYNFATVEYTETGTRHRRLVLEVRVFDDGVAFRYVLPKQDALVAVEITR